MATIGALERNSNMLFLRNEFPKNFKDLFTMTLFTQTTHIFVSNEELKSKAQDLRLKFWNFMTHELDPEPLSTAWELSWFKVELRKFKISRSRDTDFKFPIFSKREFIRNSNHQLNMSDSIRGTGLTHLYKHIFIYLHVYKHF